MQKKIGKKIYTLLILFLFTGIGIIPSLNGDIIKSNYLNIDLHYNIKELIIEQDLLDSQYIYNITEALSNIIFTEYNESDGELAKGRFFGSKGEWRAAEILAENMSKLGLYVTMERINNTPKCPDLTHMIDVLDYGLKINNKSIKPQEFHIVPSEMGPRDNPNLLDYNFTYEGLKVKLMPKFVRPWALNYMFSKEKEDFVFITIDAAFNPEATPPHKKLLHLFINPLRLCGVGNIKRNFQYSFLYNKVPQWKGVIGYDLINETYNMGANKRIFPYIYINKTMGMEILNDLDNATIDFYINQRYNDSVESYNVIGQLNGTDSSKTVIVDCLYDSWWCQGTADAAIGMAMVLGVAKYFVDNDIRPKYNLKFIGFGGEEYGMRGAISYEYIHKTENVIYVIDLNQICFTQEEPRLTLNIICNKLGFLNKIWKVVKRTNYVERTGDVTDIKPWWMLKGAPSDDEVFAMFRPFRCRTVSVLKGPPWLLHHRDGLNHTEGDVLKYFNWTDLNVTGEIVWNITEYLTVDLPGDYTSYYTDDSAINVVDFMKEKSRF